MKQLIERLFFLLVGALIATLSYTAGNADRSAIAQLIKSEVFDQVFCNELIIMGQAETPVMMFTTENGNPRIGLSGSQGAKMVLSVEDDTPQLIMGTKEGQGNRLFLFVREEGAVIHLSSHEIQELSKGVNLGLDPQGRAFLMFDGNVIR